MKFKRIYYLFAIGLYLFSVITYIGMDYLKTKKELYRTIDSDLIAAAYSVPQVLPPTLHQNALTKDSLSRSQDNENIRRLTLQANVLHIKFIYSLIQYEKKIVFTACSTNEKELKEHKEVHYFDPYDDAPDGLIRAFALGKIQYDQYTDQWGTFRSVFIPLKTDSGSRYVVAADVDISFIDQKLTSALRGSLFEVLFFVLILIPIFLLYRRHMIEITLHQEQLIVQRTKELVLAKELAENSEHAKSEFLATMSHEIRTPMNGVLGMISLLERSEMNETQKHQLHIASSSATSLLGLINDILDFSKIEAGKMDLEHFEFNLLDELHDFTEGITFKASEKGLKLILNTQEIQDPYIISDPGRIRQILTNLVGNAVKFTHKGSITITASLSRSTEQKGHLQLVIADTGIGIPSTKLETLFDPFTQADGSTTRKYGGTGLGLSIVKSLCSLMEGSVRIESTLGIGSIFYVDLTVGIGENKVQKASQIPTLLLENEHYVWPQTTRILLVEDNPTNQIVAKGMLEAIGLDADIAANGLEALEALKLSTTITPYSVILMDCQMPEMDGYDASRAIREGKSGDANVSIPIIAMTANAMSGDRERCIAAGMNDYISKPINITVLKNTLAKWLGGNPQIISSTDVPQNSEELIEETLPIWDEEEALKRLGGSTVLLQKVVQSFVKDGFNMIHSLKTAIDERNFPDAQLHAHSIKGSAANIGAKALQAIARDIEAAAKIKELTRMQTDYLECDKILHETLSLLNSYLSQATSLTPPKKRFDPLQMMLKLQTLKSKLNNGTPIDLDAEKIFAVYADDVFTAHMGELHEFIKHGYTTNALLMIDILMKQIE